MKKVTTLVVFLIIAALQLNCGILPCHTKSKQKLPTNKKLSIVGHVINAKQHLFLTLFDPVDSVYYTSCRIKPDSIICIIDGRTKIPTLEINKKYIQYIEYRYNDHNARHSDPSQPRTFGPREPSVTISYLVPICIFRFTFPSQQAFKALIPEKLRKKAYIKILKPSKSKPKQEQKKYRVSISIRSQKGSFFI